MAEENTVTIVKKCKNPIHIGALYISKGVTEVSAAALENVSNELDAYVEQGAVEVVRAVPATKAAAPDVPEEAPKRRRGRPRKEADGE